MSSLKSPSAGGRPSVWLRWARNPVLGTDGSVHGPQSQRHSRVRNGSERQEGIRKGEEQPPSPLHSPNVSQEMYTPCLLTSRATHRSRRVGETPSLFLVFLYPAKTTNFYYRVEERGRAFGDN